MTPADAQLVVDTLLQPANVGKLWDALFNSAAGDKIPLGDQAANVTDPALSSAMKFAVYNIQRAVNLGTQDPLALKTALDELAEAVAKIPTEPANPGTAPAGGSGTFIVTFDAGVSGG